MIPKVKGTVFVEERSTFTAAAQRSFREGETKYIAPRQKGAANRLMRGLASLLYLISLFAACHNAALAQEPEFLWVRPTGSINIMRAYGVATDGSDNVLIVGDSDPWWLPDETLAKYDR